MDPFRLHDLQNMVFVWDVASQSNAFAWKLKHVFDNDSRSVRGLRKIGFVVCEIGVRLTANMTPLAVRYRILSLT